jgi:hypothetical protein
MKHRFLILAICFGTLISTAVAQNVSLGSKAAADKNQEQGRSVTGQVFSKSDAPISEAVVYLKNTKTLTVKSFITEKDGGYRFHGLSPNIDYEIYADYQGQKSPTKTISSFDTRSSITLNLRLDTK